MKISHLLNRERISPRVLIKVASILIIFLGCLNANAQVKQLSPQNIDNNIHMYPSANIRGPLKTKISNGNVFITGEMATEANPVASFSLFNNTSGAMIVSQGPLLFESATGANRQTVEINPGVASGSFNIKLTVATTGVPPTPLLESQS